MPTCLWNQPSFAPRALAALAILVSPATALASHGAAPPDAVVAAPHVEGAAFHGFLGMCHLRADCPFPWAVEGNFAGSCAFAAGEGSFHAACHGAWVDLWFEFNLGGGAAYRLGGPGGPVLGGAGPGSLIHLRGMEGIVAMACGQDADGAWSCATNFRGQAVLVEQWNGAEG